MSEPWAKLEIALRSALPLFSGGELKVWIAYRLRANRNDEAWPGLEVLAEDTGLSTGRVSKHRNALVEKGGLVLMGKVRGEHGTFGSPRFRVCIPNHKSKTPHGESAAPQKNRTAKDDFTIRRKRLTPHGENDLRSRTNEVEPKSKKKRRNDTPEAETASEGATVSSTTQRMEKNQTVVSESVTAAQSAFQQFAERCDKQEAFKLLLWIIYSAARTEQVPQTTQYYLTSAENFHTQHEENAEEVLANAVERFRKHAGSFIKQRCPELLAWLEATWKELRTEST